MAKYSLGKMLSMSSRYYQQYMLEHLAKHDINTTDLAVLMSLNSDPGISLNELASTRFINKALLSRRVRRLEQMQLLDVKQDASHKQRINLYLSTEGKKLVPILRKYLNNYERDFLSVLTSEQRKEFLGLFTQLYEGQLDQVI